MSKSYFEIREALEVGTNKIVDEYKKATPGQVAEAPEDDMPASPDEAGMAMDQAKFIGYVANEIEEYIGGNKEFPEWMQNKLTGLHEKAKDMHAVMAGKYNESVDEGMKPDRLAPGWMLRQDPKLKAKVDANRAKNKEFEKSVGTKVDRVPKGEYDRKVDSYLKKKYNKEEVDSEAADLDELSQATLRSYHGKASAQAQKAKEVVKKNMAAKNPTAGSTAKAGKAYSTFSKRVKGLNRSADKMEATVTEVNDRKSERDAQINKVLGPTKNAAQGIEALKKAFKVNDAEAKKMLAQAMSESSAAYGKSEKERQEKEAKSKLTPKDKVSLDKLRAMMAKEKK